MSKVQDAIKKLRKEEEKPAKVSEPKSSDAPSTAAKNRGTEIGKVEQNRIITPTRSQLARGPSRQLDQTNLVNHGLLDPSFSRNSLTVNHREMHRRIMADAFCRSNSSVQGNNLVTFCTTSSGQGATFVALNFSLSSIRNSDVGIVLIDSNPRNPKLSQMFEAESELGLADLIVQPDLDVARVAISFDVPGFFFIPIGHNAAKIISTSYKAEIDKLLNKLSSEGREYLFLFDSGPVSEDGASTLIVRHTGQCIFVMKDSETSEKAFAAAIK
ncbi:MAG: hypothetical protein GWO38_23910, partial [Phycisphaerae bacterium]|nr:hypothetical protein [Phycisphaerae bacterium]NIP54576.1 hypothetical protein [Phycisphaerae bacterium]NIX30598.1 hypothetical protein [Phycisphaerae bacterium]